MVQQLRLKSISATSCISTNNFRAKAPDVQGVVTKKWDYRKVMTAFLSYSFKAFVVILFLACCIQQVNAQNANFVWAKSMGGTGVDISYAVAADANGNVYVTGYFSGTTNFNPGGNGDTLTSAGGNDVFLIKYSPTGAFLWAKRMGGAGQDEGRGVAVDANGNVYVTGLFSGTVNFNPGGSGGALTAAGGDVFLAKYSPTGAYLWAKRMGGTSADNGQGVALDPTGNVYVTGYFKGTANFNPSGSGDTLTALGAQDVFVAKYSPSGAFLWAKQMGGTNLTDGNAVAADATGNVYVTGYFNGTTNFNPSGSGGAFTSQGNDVFLAKFSPTGAYLWAKKMGGTSFDQGWGVAADPNGNAYVTGFFNGTANFNPDGSGGSLTAVGGDVFLAKYSPTGAYLWAKKMGGSSADYGKGVATDATGNVYVAGHFNGTANFNPDGSGGSLTSAGNIDAFLAKYDSTGAYLWAKRMGGGGTGSDQAWGVAADANRNVYVTGPFNSTTADFNPGGSGGTLNSAGANDMFVVKFSERCEKYHSFTQSACDSFVFNGRAYTASGTYVDTFFITSTNCDSIVTFSLTITGQTSANPVVSGHYCDSVSFNGQTYTATGVYVQNYTNAGGCDSNITYDLTIGHSNSGSVTQTACDSFEFHGTTYTITGIYMVTLTNESECDSIVTLDVTINTAEASVIRTGSTLTANSADSQQWINCDSNTVIPNATDQSYTVTQNGRYAVIITINDCTDTSDCVLVDNIIVGINKLDAGSKVQLYPNPTDSRVTIQTQQALNDATIRLVNLVGQLLTEQTNQHGQLFTLDMMSYAAGVYFVEISEGGNVVRMKVVKQ